MAKTRAKPVIRRSTKTARKKVGKKSKKKPASGFKVLDLIGSRSFTFSISCVLRGAGFSWAGTTALGAKR